MKPALIALKGLICLLPLASVSANEQGPRLILESLSMPPASELRYRETRMNRLLDAPQESSGIVSVADERLVKQVTAPYEETLVATSEKVVVTRNGRSRTASLKKRPEARAVFAAMRALINGDAESLLKTFDATLSESDHQWVITLTPKSAQMQRKVRRLIVTGNGTQVLAVRTERSDDNWQEMTFPVP